MFGSITVSFLRSAGDELFSTVTPRNRFANLDYPLGLVIENILHKLSVPFEASLGLLSQRCSSRTMFRNGMIVSAFSEREASKMSIFRNDLHY